MNIAILTNFMEFLPGYSLTGIVKDQITMLSQYGHRVVLYVNSKYHGEGFEGIEVRKRVPFAHLDDYMSKNDRLKNTDAHVKTTEDFAEILKEDMKEFPIVITHDFIFQGWFQPYGRGIAAASPFLPDTKWLHWIHSVPTGTRDYWNIGNYGSNHKIVYPNYSDRLHVAEQFRGVSGDIRVIPHIKDLRSWYDMDEESIKIIAAYPALMQADVVQIYPASVDRLEAKRVKEVMRLFAKIKAHGKSVCLFIANQWATTTQNAQNVDFFIDMGASFGLIPGEELIFSSKYEGGKYKIGLPKRILRDLMTCGNLFFFPTREETFGLVGPEALLSGGCMPVYNKSLQCMDEIFGFCGLSWEFGSFNRTNELSVDVDKWYQEVAWVVLGKMNQDETLKARTRMRQRFNWDHLYTRHYAPVFGESRKW